MSFRSFIEEQQRKPSTQARPSRVVELEESEDENYEETPPEQRVITARREVEEEYVDPRERSLQDEVDFYKQRLYKKIDSCFVRYGLEGLKRIDEGIAKSIARYIDGLKGGSNFEDREYVRGQARREVVKEAEEPTRQVSRPVQAQKPVVKKDEPKLNNDQMNPELIDAILNNIIPETEVHEVHIKSSIPRQAPAQEPVLAPEDSYQDIPVQEDAPAQTYDIVNEMVDDSTAREAESVDLFVPPVIEEPTEADMNSEAELDAPIVEESVTPIEVNPAESVESTPKKKRKKKAEE
jgi:hypothetical protein